MRPIIGRRNQGRRGYSSTGLTSFRCGRRGGSGGGVVMISSCFSTARTSCLIRILLVSAPNANDATACGRVHLRAITRDQQRRIDFALHRIRRPKTVPCQWCRAKIVVSRRGTSSIESTT
jgi:hypothetical protein